jgi:hypothetical protein
MPKQKKRNNGTPQRVLCTSRSCVQLSKLSTKKSENLMDKENKIQHILNNKEDKNEKTKKKFSKTLDLIF